MKRILLTFLLILSLVSSASAMNLHQAWMMGAGAAAPTYACTDATHDSANTAITFCEDFDGASTCTATYTSNCRNAWLVIGGTPDYDNTTNLIEGTYSLYLDITSANYTGVYKALTSGGTYYSYAHMKVIAIPTAARSIGGTATDGAARSIITFLSNGTLRLYHGTANQTISGALVAGHTYAIWHGYIKGTGSDGFAYVAIAEVTTGAPPSKPTLCDYSVSSCADAASAVITNGTATADVNRMKFGTVDNSDTTLKLSFDHIRINTSDFGSNVP